MKTSIKIFALVVIVMIAGFTNKVNAQATENTAAGARIIVPMTMTEVTALNFGSMSVLAGTPGTCVLSTTGVRSATGGVNLSAVGTAASNASFNVTGNGTTTYLITLPATITVTGTTTSEIMTIGTLLARTTSTGADGTSGTLNAGGTDSFTVGGTLNVPAGQVAQTYAGTFNVTVAYN